MIMWEFTSGFPPFDDIEHGFQLSLNICNGKRPKIIENTPQCYIDLMKKCWNEDPLKRPDAFEIKKIINYWISNIAKNINEKSESENIKVSESKNIDKESKLENIDESENIIKEFYEADKFLKQKQTNVSTFKSHPQAYHTSRLLDFTKPLNEILNQKENAKAEYSGMLYF